MVCLYGNGSHVYDVIGKLNEWIWNMTAQAGKLLYAPLALFTFSIVLFLHFPHKFLATHVRFFPLVLLSLPVSFVLLYVVWFPWFLHKIGLGGLFAFDLLCLQK